MTASGQSGGRELAMGELRRAGGLVRPDARAATIVVRGAHVVDPREGLDRVLDVAVEDGRITAVGEGVTVPEGADFKVQPE